MKHGTPQLRAGVTSIGTITVVWSGVTVSVLSGETVSRREENSVEGEVVAMIGADSAKTLDFSKVVDQAIELNGVRWVLIFADMLRPALFDQAGVVKGEAQTVIADAIRCVPPGKVARLRLIIADYHLLALVLPDLGTCRLYTPGLAQETFLLRLLADTRLQEHVDAVRQYLPTVTSIETVTAKCHRLDLPSLTVAVGAHKRTAMIDMVIGQVDVLVRLEERYRPPLTERIQNAFLNLLAREEQLLRQVLRFVALLPSLRYDRSRREVVRALRENVRLLRYAHIRTSQRQSYRARLMMYTAQAVALVTRIVPSGMVGAVINWAVGVMAARFIVPENPAAVRGRLKDLERLGRWASLDQLGELVLTQQEAERYADRVMQLIDLAATHYTSSADHRVINAAGIPQAHVSVKLSALSIHFNPAAPEATAAEMRDRLLRLLRHAKQRGAFLCFDAEHYAYRDLSLRVPAAVLAATPDLNDFQDFGFVVQAYLQDAVPFIDQIAALARQRGHHIQIRLVKGAYWDAETAEAKAQDVPTPTFLNKAETDIHFQQLVRYILEQSDILALAVGSHNLREHALAEVVRSEIFPQAPVIEHQILHRMTEGVARALTGMGWATRDYMPVGELVPGIAYLVRRILENSSQVGILAQSRERLSAADIATDPALSLSQLIAQGKYVWDPALRGADERFRPSPPLRLDLPVERGAFAQVLASTTVKTPVFVTAADVPHLVCRAVQGAEAWQAWSPEARAAVLIRAAEAMRAQRLVLGALIVREGRKIWAEALADVDEAIDYLRFYARSAVHWHTVLQDRLQPLGVAAVIAPWNFPLAIPCGMTAAALAAGNVVLLKPAEQTPATGAALATLLHTSGIPSDALVYVPGDGEVGAALVAHDQIDLIAFTGSWEVGAQIVSTSARVPTRRLRRVIAETGSKNPIVVTASADLDTAIEGILWSAFSHAGQKCSACSRVLVDARLVQPLAARLGQAAKELRLGSAEDPATQVNPVITAADAGRLCAAAVRATAEALAVGGRVVIDATSQLSATDLVGPAIFLLPEGVDLTQVPSANEELFGPIVHIIPYTTREEAVWLANSVPYALTAGIFAQSANDVDFFMRRLDAGSLYINRPITAARVGVEPFGGYKRSGTGPKAGGDDYLLAFVDIVAHQPMTVTATVEEILRASHEAMAPHPTVDIPGQLNTLVYDRPLGHGLVLADAPSYFRHAVVAAALVAGNHLTVVAKDRDEAQALRETAVRVGTHQPVGERLQIIVGSDKEALEAVSAFVFIAGADEALRRAAYAYPLGPDLEQLPAFIGLQNGALPDLPVAFTRRFLRPRLIAENTIRHGALISTGGMWT
jgi:RHH-type proline utilization regulon transcriptional repressor/proline dehydrogenase/delta 1-pyrroline-5-carboxylate dehydrogenase